MAVSRFLVILGVIALLGAGCSVLDKVGVTDGSGSASTSTALQAAQSIQFQPGDTFEVRQTVLGFGAFLPDFLKSKDGVRLIEIKRFAPFYHASLAWTLTAKESNDKGELVDVTATGTVSDLNIRNSHSAFLPAYWSEGDLSENERSGIWLADDPFQELSRTGHTVLNLGVFDAEANAAAKNVSDLKSVLSKLRNQAEEDGKYRDLTLMQAESEPIDWTLTVNGEEKHVSAIQAHSWFGDVVILNNRQNPLILKVTLNPITSAAADAATSGNGGMLDKLYGYEIDNITIKH